MTHCSRYEHKRIKRTVEGENFEEKDKIIIALRPNKREARA